jgi:hypothetical protein
MDSINMAMVIREGKACGLMMTSGDMPDSLKGMFSCGHSWDMTPFCPCLDANLSPITGLRLSRSLIDTRWIRPLLDVPTTRTSSTTASSLLLYRCRCGLPVPPSTVT